MTPEQRKQHICNLIPRIHSSHPQYLKYVSKFNEQTKQEIRDSRRCHANFGCQHYEPNHPCNYIRKQSKKPYSCIPQQSEKVTAVAKVDHHMPVSFKQCDHSQHNFLTKNIKQVEMQQNIYVPERKYADTNGGDTHALQPSGLQLCYVFKREFGRCPRYVLRRRHQLQHELLQHQRRLYDAVDARFAKRVSEVERAELLKGLKENWSKLNKAYLAQSLCIDNLNKKFRKESLEYQLKDLEKDIDLIERNEVILIASPRGLCE